MSITIKQAFQKLAMVTGAAVKNPWFIGRNLNQAFADIADNIEGGGGGSTVVVTPIVESGTKIATITVDDVGSDLYAPTASHNYSTTEQVVGKWIDGTTDVYEKVISFQFEGTSQYSFAGIASLNKAININIDGSGAYVSYGQNNYVLGYKYTYEGAPGIMIERGTGATFSGGDLIVQYTKSSS